MEKYNYPLPFCTTTVIFLFLEKKEKIPFAIQP
uniref:Uncharacterized protein n=1 Tax=Arundo donax TaxID=35708 RepID=A0A0A8YBA1_ARUDO